MVDVQWMSAQEGQPEDRVRSACIDQVNHSVTRAGVFAPAAALLLALIFIRALPAGEVFGWFGAVTIANLFAAFWAAIYLRKRTRGERTGPWTIGPISMAMTGLAWGSLPAFVFPPINRYDLRALYLVALCAVSAANAIGAAARQSYFIPFQLALFLPIEVACLSATDRQTQLFGLTIPAFLCAMVLLHRQVHTLIVSELRLHERNERANEELRNLNTRLGEIALRDGLTGSVNRVAFVDALSRMASTAGKDGSFVGVLFLDLDRFKSVNDLHGHQAGDELLVQVAGRIRSTLRDNDILGRPGGDEFTVLLVGLRGREDAIEAAHRILDAFVAPFTIGEVAILMTASIGVTVGTSADESAQELLRQADMAQYLAKENGRNRVECFAPILQPLSRRQLDRERALRDALSNGEIVAYFQPQVDLKDGSIAGASVLARWHHPHRGVVSAREFISLANESDLVLDIEAAVLRNAISARVALWDAGWGPDFRIWCTLSSYRLGRPDPFADLLDEIRRQGCPPQGIGLGLPEEVVAAHLATFPDLIVQLRHLGVGVSLDGFGAGHSSLQVLRSISADQLRLSRDLIDAAFVDDRETAIIGAVISLGKELGLTVVAEGVETLHQAQGLGRANCDRGQGFLWSEAVPLGVLQTMLRQTLPVRSEYSEVR